MAESLEISGDEVRKNVRKKNVQPKVVAEPGLIAHYHRVENEVEEWDEPCLFREHHVGVPGGLKINDDVYSGSVVVPQCVSDYLAKMEADYIEYERGIFHNRGQTRHLRELKG